MNSNSMKILHISDKALNLPYRILADKPENLAKQIFENYADKELFLINVNYKTENISRADNAGILFLKFFRLNHFNQHCVLYSFLSREQLMAQDIRNLIIFSEGVTFIRMPEDLNQIDFEKLKDNKAPADLSAFFKAEYTLPDNSHFMANWWGVLQLWKVQEQIEINAGVKNIPRLDHDLANAQREITSYEGLVARYIKAMHEKDLKGIVKSAIGERIVEDDEKQLNNRFHSLSKIRKELQNKTPSIIFVDDQAGDGWAAVFQRIIYGGISNKFRIVQPQKDDQVELIAEQIFELIRQTVPDLIILDLRLKGERGQINSANDISGVQVLRLLSEKRIPCPVLITSASTKIGSFKVTMNLGADAYWIKEGLNENTDLNRTIENYLRFVELIYTLCFSPEYRYLYKSFYPAITEIENATQNCWWWEKTIWNEADIVNRKGETIKFKKYNPTSRKEIIDTLITASSLVKKLLNDETRQDVPVGFSNFTASLIILICANVLESVHKADKHNEDLDLQKKMKHMLGNDLYKKYSKLVTIRNNTAHKFNAHFYTVKEFTQLLLKFLQDNTINQQPQDEHVNQQETVAECVQEQTGPANSINQQQKSEQDDQQGAMVIRVSGQSEPVDGHTYCSVVLSKEDQLKRYNLSNPGLNLKSNRKGILLYYDHIPENMKDEIQIGNRVEYKLKEKENKGITNYYANNARIIL